MMMTELPAVQGMVRLCEDGWLQGWHERNGGNVTYRLTREEQEAAISCLAQPSGPWTPLGISAPNLGGEWFLATGSGKYFRNVPLDPVDALCLVELNDAGDCWRLRWGLSGGGKPTSELAAHLINHSVRKEATGGACRVMYHAHPAHIVAMSFLLPLTDREISRALWQSETEAPMVFPGGVGVVGCMVPGSIELAWASSEKMKEYDAVVWAHHGLFCSGPDLDTAFGLMHTVEKAAQVWTLVRSCGGARQLITDDEIRAIAEGCGVQIREEFLQ
ncbi:MAG: rhamnulose-1-phosphate aldolase [Clostridiales bacterium]|nr:rhamnulose-1-phosphate aldolase [Clostridiales bacterium]